MPEDTECRAAVETPAALCYTVTVGQSERPHHKGSGGERVKIEVRIEEGVTEPKLVIIADRMTDELSDLVRRLSGGEVTALAGFRGEEAKLIGEEDIIRVYASDGKVFAVTDTGEYRLRLRLYELEERLSGRSFVRISNAEIVNIKKVRGFDLSLAGTICVSLSNGETTYASRRYVSKIKQILGL